MLGTGSPTDLFRPAARTSDGQAIRLSRNEYREADARWLARELESAKAASPRQRPVRFAALRSMATRFASMFL